MMVEMAAREPRLAFCKGSSHGTEPFPSGAQPGLPVLKEAPVGPDIALPASQLPPTPHLYKVSNQPGP